LEDADRVLRRQLEEKSDIISRLQCEIQQLVDRINSMETQHSAQLGGFHCCGIVAVIVTLTLWRPLLPHGHSYIKHPEPDRVKPSFVICDIRALWRSVLTSECPDVKNYKWRLNPVGHRMLYSCTNTATVIVKGLNRLGRWWYVCRAK